MGQESSSPPCFFLISDVGRRLFPQFFGGNRRVTEPEISHEMRSPAHEMRQASRPNRLKRRAAVARSPGAQARKAIRRVGYAPRRSSSGTYIGKQSEREP